MLQVTTTAFFTHCWKRARADLSARLGCALFVLLQALAPQARSAEIVQLDLGRVGEGLELGAVVQFDLPAAVQDALFKGLPVIFVQDVEVYRERWYWLDKRVGGAQRHMRLIFQPLVRRWRLSTGAGPASASEPGLAQNFDSLEEALAVIRRVSAWRVADFADLDLGARHRVEFRFRLDLTQLPRPLQIGTLGESDWALSISTSRRLQPETLR